MAYGVYLWLCLGKTAGGCAILVTELPVTARLHVGEAAGSVRATSHIETHIRI